MRNKIFLAGTLALATAACGSDGTGPNDTGADAALNLSVATVAADGTAGDVDIMAGLNGIPGNITVGAALMDPPEGPGNTNGCGFGGGRWTCPSNSANGLTIIRSLAFYDGADVVQEEYDAETTARMEIEASLEGDVSRGPWTATTYRHRMFDITGLEGTETERTVNGTAEADIERFRDAGNSPDRSYDMEADITVEDVVIPVRAEGVDPWPTSGTMTRVYTVVLDGGDPVVRTVIITFDGTATPPATVNGEAFELDLHNRRAFRR
jgi:hypothetical protein